MQRALIQFAVPKNHLKVKKALIKANRQDLIGNGKDCLIGFVPGKLGYQGKHKANSKSSTDNSIKNTSDSSNRKSASSKNNNAKSSFNKNPTVSKNTSDVNFKGSKSTLSNGSNKNAKNAVRKSSNTKKRVH